MTPRNGTIGTVIHSKGKIYPSDHMFVLDFNNTADIRFMFYYISNIIGLNSKKHGTTIPNITKSDIQKSSVNLPSKEKQKKIVEYCDNLMDMIQKQEKQIELNKELMKHIMDDYLNSNNSANDTYSNKSVDSDSDSEEDQSAKHVEQDSDSDDDQPKKKIEVIEKDNTSGNEKSKK
jgi:restriction endonuclease S subunit